MPRRIFVALDPGHVWAEISGYGSRDLIIGITGRPPLWLSRTRVWTATYRTGLDVIAAAESRGFDVVLREAA